MSSSPLTNAQVKIGFSAEGLNPVVPENKDIVINRFFYHLLFLKAKWEQFIHMLKL